VGQRRVGVANSFSVAANGRSLSERRKRLPMDYEPEAVIAHSGYGAGKPFAVTRRGS
jgi:hypothetical protein